MNRSYFNAGVALSLIVLAVLLRIVPHPANFAPVAAVAIFGGALLPRRLAVVVPLGVMMLSDVIIGLHPLIFVTWGCYALIALAAHRWLKKGSFTHGVIITLSSSLFFFIVTNFAVWLQGELYPRTLSGLAQCFMLAVPFFRNTLLSDLLYTAGLFGLYGLAVFVARKSLHSEDSLSTNQRHG